MEIIIGLIIAFIIYAIFSKDTSKEDEVEKHKRLKAEREKRIKNREESKDQIFLGRVLIKELNAINSNQTSVDEFNKKYSKYSSHIKNFLIQNLSKRQEYFMRENNIEKEWPQDKKIRELQNIIIKEKESLDEESKKYPFIKELFPDRYKS